MSDVYVYVIAHEESGGAVAPIKVGVGRSPRKRRRALQTGNPKPLVLFSVLRMPDRKMASYLETAFHEIQKEHCLMGEWFNMDPRKAKLLLELYLVGALNLGTTLSNEEKDTVFAMALENHDV